MKKLIKALAVAGGVISAAALVNHYIFKFAGVPVKSRFGSNSYRWRHGKINYIVAGEGDAILMLHGIGTGCSLTEWEEQIALLSKSHRVYAFDFLGFGDSEKPRLSYSAYLYASLINDFIENVIGEKVFVVASSTTSSHAAAACALRPELYKKLLLVSPTGVGSSNKQATERSLFIRCLIELPILGTSIYNTISSRFYCRYFLERYCHSNLTTDTIMKYYYSAHRGGVGAKYPIAAFFARLLNVDLNAIIPKIKAPVHVVWGDANEMNPVSNFNAIKDMNVEIQLTVFEGAKLLPHKDQPKKFYKLCKDFFA